MRVRLPPWTVWLLVFLVACTGIGAYLSPPDLIRIGAFSDADASNRYPPGWTLSELVNGHKQTAYELVETERGTVVRAESKGGISSLYIDRRIALKTHPILEWSWNVKDLAETANVRARARNDLTASITIAFAHNELGVVQRLKHFLLRVMGYYITSNRLLIYYWANEEERGSVSKNLHAGWFTQVALRSGSTHVGTWVQERRNVLKDYRAIYGEDPPPIESISITTETNSTEEHATAYYGDIVFRTDADSLIGPSLTQDRPSN